MKQIEIVLDENTYNFYKDIAEIVHRDIADILADTLYKVLDILDRSINVNDDKKSLD